MLSTSSPSPPLDTLPPALPLFTQIATSVEVDTEKGNEHPYVMTSGPYENNPDPSPQSNPQNACQQPSKDEDTHRITFVISSLLMAMCFPYCKAIHRLIAVSLRGFSLILTRLGRHEIIDQLPNCMDSIYTCL